MNVDVIGKTVTGVILALFVLVITSIVTHEAPRYETQGTFKTQYLVVDSDGQNALFSTYSASTGAVGNVWIGGGGQSWLGSVFPTTGQNTSLGIGALALATTGNADTAIGFNALGACTTCYTSTAVGTGALSEVTTGIDNTAVGYLAAIHVSTGSTNTAVGVETLSACTTGGANVAIGISAGQLITTGSENVALGHASFCGTTGSNNTCLGASSGAGIQGAIADVAIGPFTLQAATSSNANVAIGSTALTAVSTGANNTAVGVFAASGVTTGSENAAVGDHALGLAGNVSNNTAIGSFALENNTVGFNVAVGYLSATTITSGVANTVVGYNNTTGITTGNGNTIIGSNVGGLAGGTTDVIIVADGSGNMIEMSALAPTSVSAGALGAGSENTQGNVTGPIGATTVTLTFSGAPFVNHAWCHAQPNDHSVAPEYIEASLSITAPVFSCFNTTTGAAANCDPFTYWCTGN